MGELDSLQTDSISVLASLINKEAIANGDYEGAIRTVIDRKSTRLNSSH